MAAKPLACWAISVAENGKEGERWLKRAVEAGYNEAASILGLAYAIGKPGLKRNIPLAREMLTKAASQGDEQSREILVAIDKRKAIFRNLE